MGIVSRDILQFSSKQRKNSFAYIENFHIWMKTNFLLVLCWSKFPKCSGEVHFLKIWFEKSLLRFSIWELLSVMIWSSQKQSRLCFTWFRLLNLDFLPQLLFLCNVDSLSLEYIEFSRYLPDVFVFLWSESNFLMLLVGFL